MAALTPAQIELANSLLQDDLPTKLRCAICSKLAINAFRLPCCETAICESCQSTLPSSCPVCEHSPVAGADCTIYKSLRTTIRVFLKTEEKKREAARPKTNGSVPPTPVESKPTPALAMAQAPAAHRSRDAPVQLKDTTASSVADDAHVLPTIEPVPQGDDLPLLAEDSGAHAEQETGAAGDDQEFGDDAAQAMVSGGQDGDEDLRLENTNEESEAADESEQSGQMGMGYGQESMNGSFNGMNFAGGDMNQMQMMMAMQNGMNPAAFGSFPMMGMGMGMDPMTMQNMYMNGGFGAQGMGMNGMNMGMNGFNGGNNDWNGQQSWNVAQDNFNPNAAGMGNGDFGNFNSGFRTGYNSGNYGHQNQYNDYGRGGYGFRGRGRGRGFNRGYGRGYQQGFNSRPYGQEMWAEQNTHDAEGNPVQQIPHGPNSLEDAGEEQKPGNTDEFGRTVRASEDQGPADGQDGPNTTHGDHTGHAGDQGEAGPLLKQSSHQNPGQIASNGPGGNDDNAAYNGEAFAYQQSRRGGSSYGATSVPPTVPVPDVPLNAPTGPKAMRQGLPNTSTLHLRARGFIPDERSPVMGSPVAGPNAPIVASPAENRPTSRGGSRTPPREVEDRHLEGDADHKDEPDDDKITGKDYGIDKSGPGDIDPRPYSRSRSRSSRSRDRKESRRHRRHRSGSVSEHERDDDRRRKHRSRRSTRDDEDSKRRPKDDKHEDRSRSASPERDHDREHRRSSHRGHRDRDKDKERDSDRDRHRKSSHRSHRDNDRDSGKEKDRSRDEDRGKDRPRDRDRDRDRDRVRDRDRDREHRHRSRRTSAEPATPLDPPEKEFNPPTGPRGGASTSIKGPGPKNGGFEIKGASNKPATNSRSDSFSKRRDGEPSRRASQASVSGAKAPPTGPAKDVHTLEREARDRERLLKEAQRMAGLIGSAGMKRGREAGDDRNGRRKSRRSEAVYGDEEERMRRLEAEREGGRWD